MSRHGSAPLRRFAVVLCAILAAVAVYACTERSDIVDIRRPSSLTFAPRYSNMGSVFAPIVRIRITVKSVTSNSVIAADTVDVDPDAPQWQLNVEVPGDAGTVIALFELLNAAGAVEYSGQTGPIAVAPGEKTNPTTPVELFPGGLDNLSITALSISPHTQNVVEGGTVQLNAAVSGGGPGTHITWESLDGSVASVDGTGLVTTVRNGTVRIRAAAGPRADTAILSVSQRPASVRVTPDTIRITTLGAEGVFTAQVFDPRNAPIAGEVVTWTSANAGVAESLGNGRFRAAGAGTTQITGTSASNTALRATAVMVVTPRASRVVVTPSAISLDVGATIPLSAAVQDANGNPVAGTVVWRTANAAIATVDANGVVTGAGAGSTQIRAVVGAGTPDSIFGIASLTITQSVRSVEVSPDGASLQSIGDTMRFSAVAKDAAGVPVPGISFTWSATGGAVTINSSGLATAVANGNSTVTATALGVTGSVSVSVAQRVTSMTLTPTSDTVAVNDSVQFSAVGRDARNTHVTSAVFNWTSSDTTIATVNANGFARGRAAGTATIRATSASNNTVTATASLLVTASAPPPPPPPPTSGPAATVTIQAGDGQTSGAGGAVGIPPAVIVKDSAGNPVAGVNVTFAVATGGGSIVGPAVIATGTNGVAAVGGWTLGTTPGSNTLTATVGTLPVVTFTATGATVAPAISMALGGGRTNVGVSFTTPLTVSLNTPAPAGGVTVTVTSSDTTKVRVVSPGTVFIAAGGTTGSVNLNGVAAGNATLTATGTGYSNGTLAVTASLRLISLPLSLNVPYTQSASLPVQLAEPAPTGGTVVSLVISDTTKLIFPSGSTAATTTVTVPAGSTTANATVFGRLPGTATVTASATDYVNGSTPVTVQANLDILQSSLSINQSFGGALDIRFQTNGSPIAAPSPGLTVNLSAANPACVSVPATATIATGLTQITVNATYGGTATLSCTTKVYATANNIVGDSVTVTVSSLPLITTSNIPLLGQGLSTTNSFFLGASNHGGVTVHIASNDTTRLRVSTSAASLGGSAIDIFVPNGQTSVSFTMQGMNVDTGAVSFTVSAPGFTTATQNLTIVRPVYELQFLSNTTVYSTPPSVIVRVGVSSNGTTISSLQAIRAGLTAPTFQLTSSDSTKAKLVTVTDTARVVSITVPVGQFQSASTVASGGAVLLPLSAGTVSVTASTTANMTALTTATRSVTITSPTISTSNFLRIGAGLQALASASLGASSHGGVTVHIQSNDTTRLLVSPNGTTAGTDAIDIVVANGTTFIQYYVQARERTSSVVDTATVSIAAAGFTTNTSSWIIAPLAVDVSGLNTSTVALATPVFFPVRVGPANSVNTGLASFSQTPRAGGPGVPVTVTLSDTTKAKLVYGVDTVTTVTGTIQPNEQYLTVYFKPLAAGVDTVRATSTAAGVTVTSGTRVVTISAPTMSLTRGYRIGSGLEDYTNNYLSAAQHGGVTVHLVSSDSTKMLLSTAYNVVGAGTLDIVVPNGQTYFTYYMQALENVTGPVTVTVSAPGFATDTATHTIVQPALGFSGPSTPTTTLSGDQTFSVYIGASTVGNTGVVCCGQYVRAGGPGYNVTINSSTTAGQLLSPDTAQRGGTITVPIVATQYITNAKFRPLTAGTTLLTATAPGVVSTPAASRSITVTAPGFSSFTSSTVGAGLMKQVSGNLAAPAPAGTVVRIRSSNPTVAKVAANSTTAATDSVDIVMSTGQTFFSYYIHGMEGQTGTVNITGSASGYTDGNATATVVTPGYQIGSLSTQFNTASDVQPFYVFVGTPNSNNTGLTDYQAVRFGGTARTATVTSSTPSVGRVGALPDTVWSNTATATIPVGSYYTNISSQPSLYFNPTAAGTTTVTAAVSGFVAQTSASVNITVAAASFTNVYGEYVGAGLMQSTYFYLSGGHHGGVTVHLVSADPTRLLLSANDTTAGTASIDIFVPAGETYATYYIHGVELKSGLVNVTMTAPGFATQTIGQTVMQPAVDISNLSSSWSVSYGNEPLTVRVGIKDPSGGNYMYDVQQVRAGSSGFTATVTSSNTAVGSLETSAGVSSPKTITIPARMYQTPYYAQNGGIEFKPIAPGSVTITATIPNFILLPGATVPMTITN